MSILEALILGLLQGAAEFLPISSSGHLVLVPWWLGWDDPPLMFDVVVHVGTTVAIITYFWRDWLGLLVAGWQAIRERAITTPQQKILLFILLGTIPGVVAGLLLEDYFESVFSEPILVAGMLLVTASLLVLSETLAQGGKPLDDLSLSDALIIGTAQALAIIPGISRSGSTIAAGLVRDFSRSDAARYSFLLATPIIIGAGAKQGLDVILGEATLQSDMVGALVVGFLASALMGYACIVFLLALVRRQPLYGFAVYCVVFGLVSILAAASRG